MFVRRPAPAAAAGDGRRLRPPPPATPPTGARQPAALRAHCGRGAGPVAVPGPRHVGRHLRLDGRSPTRAAPPDMAAHGIRTLYLETGNWRRPYAVVHPKQDAQLIEAAHAHGMKVVTWYLPKFENVDDDFRRVMQSIELTTPKGQRPDAFGLDIEAPEVEPTQRIENLLTLSARLRAEVGTGYALGAIIPSPRGMIRVPDYWPGFPYQRIPEFYDLIMPMSYYTFHYDSAKADAQVHQRQHPHHPGPDRPGGRPDPPHRRAHGRHVDVGGRGRGPGGPRARRHRGEPVRVRRHDRGAVGRAPADAGAARRADAVPGAAAPGRGRGLSCRRATGGTPRRRSSRRGRSAGPCACRSGPSTPASARSGSS